MTIKQKSRKYFVVSKKDFDSGDSFVLYSGRNEANAKELVRIAIEQDKALNQRHFEYEFVSMGLEGNLIGIYKLRTNITRADDYIFHLSIEQAEGLVKLLGGDSK